MRDQLIDYVNSCFAGHPQAEDIRQEILQNTLDRYDDLVADGKNPQAAYSMAIAGIGDIEDLLKGEAAPVSEAAPQSRKLLRAIGVGLYILCPVPVIILDHTRYQDMVGVPLMFLFIAMATVLMILSSRGGRKTQASPEQKRRSSIGSIVWLTATLVYFLISIFTQAWFVTWLIFPIAGAVNGLIRAIFDLKGGQNQ